MAQCSVEEKLALLREHDDGVPRVRIAEHSGVPARTLRRWAAAYRADSTSLRRPARSNKGHRRMPAEVVEALALRHPAPTTAYIHRRVGDIARDRGPPALSYSSIRVTVHAVDSGLRALATKGEAAYRDRFKLVFRRNAERPNEQWQADHTLLDVAVLGKDGAGVRPWLTIVLDDCSRAVAGFALFLGAPNAEQTALALHHAINRKTNPPGPSPDYPTPQL